MNKYRVIKCEKTKKPILQIKDGKGWLCLHKENALLDQMQVDGFLAGSGGKKVL